MAGNVETAVAKFFLKDERIFATKVNLKEFSEFLKTKFHTSQHVIINNEDEGKFAFIPTNEISFIILGTVEGGIDEKQ